MGCSFLREVRHVNCVTQSFFYRTFLRDNGVFYLYQGGIIGEQRLVYLHVVDIFQHVTRIARPLLPRSLSLSHPSPPPLGPSVQLHHSLSYASADTCMHLRALRIPMKLHACTHTHMHEQP